jgi:hypothetical protein
MGRQRPLIESKDYVLFGRCQWPTQGKTCNPPVFSIFKYSFNTYVERWKMELYADIRAVQKNNHKTAGS